MAAPGEGPFSAIVWPFHNYLMVSASLAFFFFTFYLSGGD